MQSKCRFIKIHLQQKNIEVTINFVPKFYSNFYKFECKY